MKSWVLATIIILTLIYADFSYSQISDELYNLAVSSYKVGNFKKASEHLEEYVKLKPSAEAYYLLGYSYYKLKLFNKAEEAFKEAYLIDPELVLPKIDSISKEAEDANTGQ